MALFHSAAAADDLLMILPPRHAAAAITPIVIAAMLPPLLRIRATVVCRRHTFVRIYNSRHTLLCRHFR